MLLPQASLNFDDPALEALLKALPEAPAMARRQCLKMCGMNEPDEHKGGKSPRPHEDGGKKFCNSIGCPNGFTPIPHASDVACNGNECKVEQCCEAFCSYHACPNNFVPVKDADSIKCTDSKCSTEQCCDEVKNTGGGAEGSMHYCKDIKCPKGYQRVPGHLKDMKCYGPHCVEECCEEAVDYSYDHSYDYSYDYSYRV